MVLVQVLCDWSTETRRRTLHVDPLSSSIVVGLALVDGVSLHSPGERSVALLRRRVVLRGSSDSIVVRVDSVVSSQVSSRDMVLVEDEDLPCPGILGKHLMRLLRPHPPQHGCLVDQSSQGLVVPLSKLDLLQVSNLLLLDLDIVLVLP